MNRPLAVDLFCGLGGWTEGLLAEGYEVLGFDIEQHVYGEHRYPAQLVLQDVRTLHGRQFKDAALIVASPPCQAYSYRAMPWKRAKALPPPSNELFEACFRIQREASEAAGHHVPLVVENVKGAQPYVGRSRWNFGSFHLWGDVPALMPMTKAIKNGGGSWFNIAHNTESENGQNPDGRKLPSFRFDGSGQSFQSAAVRRTALGLGARFTSWDCGVEAAEGRKGAGAGAAWFDANLCRLGSDTPARKAASAQIAKIPLPLARHIAKSWYPRQAEVLEKAP